MAVMEEKGDRCGCMRWVEWAVDTQVNKYLLFLSQTWLGRVRRGQGWAQPFSGRVHHGSRSDPQRPCCGVGDPPASWGLPRWVLLAVWDVKTLIWRGISPGAHGPALGEGTLAYFRGHR